MEVTVRCCLGGCNTCRWTGRRTIDMPDDYDTRPTVMQVPDVMLRRDDRLGDFDHWW